MTILQSDLRKYSSVSIQKGLNEARNLGNPTAFLSHSHKDADLAGGLQAYLNKQGWNVYIDWQDNSMPDKPNRETADKIRQKIRDLDLFLFLATANSMASRWCPWELGYADGKKLIDTILIIPTQDTFGNSHGSEYLLLYNHLNHASSGGIGSFNAQNRGYVLRENARPSVPSM